MALSLSDATSAGQLKRVEYLFEDGLRRPVGVSLAFEKGRLLFIASAADDQLAVVDDLSRVGWNDVSETTPWRSALGRNCLWTWSLTNQTGHTDGAQLLFAAPPEPEISVQLIVVASQFDIHLVGDPLPTDLTGESESGV